MDDDATVDAPLDDNATVDAMLDGIEVPVPLPTLDPALRWAFVCDIAQRSYPEEEIAKRYGFADALTMVAYIRNDKELIRTIKVRRAYWDSDVGLPEKLRTLYGHTLQYSGVGTRGHRHVGRTLRITNQHPRRETICNDRGSGN